MSESASSAVVNTNTAEVAEPVVAGGGEAPVSWDQLEGVSSFQHQVAKRDVKQEIQAEKEAKKELGEKVTEEKTTKSTVKKVPKEKEEKEQQKPESKKLKLKHEDQDLEIPTDLRVPVKIDGRTEEVTLQEALSRYSQQKHLDKIYQDYKKEKAAFDSERGTIKQTYDQLRAALTDKKDLRGVIEAVAEPLGLDPAEVYSQFRQKMETDLEEAMVLTPGERRAKTLEDELNYYKQRQQTERQKQIETQQRQELEQQVEQVISQSGMDKEAFVKSYDELINLGYKAEDLSPEQISSYYVNLKTIEMVEQKVAELNPEIAQDADEMERITTLILTNRLTPEEIDEVVSQLYSSEADKKLSKKINKSMAKAKAETPVKNPGKDPLFFDDI